MSTLSPNESPKAVLIYSGRNEFQAFMMILSVISGIGLLFGSGDEDTANLPTWLQVGWGIGLAFCGLVNLFASFFPWKDARNGLVLERVSCIGLFVSSLAYMLALLGLLDNVGVLQFLILDLFALIALIRAFRLSGYISGIDKLRKLEKNVVESVPPYVEDIKDIT